MRNAVGGGAPWQRKGVGPNSKFIRTGQHFSQGDLASEAERFEAGPDALWEGRGIGRGPLWPEGGGAGNFRKNAGWTGDWAMGKQRPPDVGAADAPEAVRGARASLQVFKTFAGNGRAERMQDIPVEHGNVIGRDLECAVALEWDGISRRHAQLEAFAGTSASTRKAENSTKGEKSSGPRWFVTSLGGNGTFVNGIRYVTASARKQFAPLAFVLAPCKLSAGRWAGVTQVCKRLSPPHSGGGRTRIWQRA